MKIIIGQELMCGVKETERHCFHICSFIYILNETINRLIVFKKKKGRLINNENNIMNNGVHGGRGGYKGVIGAMDDCRDWGVQ